MKKFIFIIVLALTLTSIVYAEEIAGCMNPAADNFSILATIDDGSCYIRGCTSSNAINHNPAATIDNGSCVFPTNGDPNKVVNGWGLTNEQSKIVSGGTIIKDSMGIVWDNACPKWQPKCVDLTDTDFYKNSMKKLARQLLDNGFFVKFPIFNAWYAAVK